MEEGRKGRGQRRFEERGGGSSDGISISKELTSVFQFHQIQPYYQSGRKQANERGQREVQGGRLQRSLSFDLPNASW